MNKIIALFCLVAGIQTVLAQNIDSLWPYRKALKPDLHWAVQKLVEKNKLIWLAEVKKTIQQLSPEQPEK